MEDWKKKYEELFGHVQDFHKRFSDQCSIKKEIEECIPELAESEDERIRKYIQNELACLRATEDKGSERYNELSSAIAYLEKQKDNKFAPQVLPCSAAWFEGGEEFEQKEQKPIECEWPNLSNCIKNCKKCHGKCFYRKEPYEEQKPAECDKTYESEPMEIRYAGKVYKVHGIREFPGGRNGYIIEDEPGHYDCILNPDEVLGGSYGIKSNGSPYPTNDITFSEKPAEWSEEDEKMLWNIISIVGESKSIQADEMLDWLKFLRPQPHWKPSEEQMEQLRSAAVLPEFGPMVTIRKQFPDLESLYNDLKKLM